MTNNREKMETVRMCKKQICDQKQDQIYQVSQ